MLISQLRCIYIILTLPSKRAYPMKLGKIRESDWFKADYTTVLRAILFQTSRIHCSELTSRQMNFTCPFNSKSSLIWRCVHAPTALPPPRHLFARGLCNNTRKREALPAHSLGTDVRDPFPTIIRGNYRHGGIHVSVWKCAELCSWASQSGKNYLTSQAVKLVN